MPNDTCQVSSPSAQWFLSSFYAPNFEKVGDILVSACPYVCMCVFMFEKSS